ncbi:hypothetical protein BDR05DRAFT_959247 [Suillus weaverae]|nr:hypothetical protein BDR05DRAFT_959247 [Suillus weaverae]
MGGKPALLTTYNAHDVQNVNTTMLEVPDTARDANLTLGGHAASARTTQWYTNVLDGVAFFNDSRRVVTGSRDCTLRM